MYPCFGTGIIAIPPTNIYDSLSEPVTHSVIILVTLDWYYNWFTAHSGYKYMSVSDILVHNIAYKLWQTSLIELEIGTNLRYHYTKSGQRFARAYCKSFALARQRRQFRAFFRLWKRNSASPLIVASCHTYRHLNVINGDISSETSANDSFKHQFPVLASGNGSLTNMPFRTLVTCLSPYPSGKECWLYAILDLTGCTRY